jgi:hypothetical protein
MKNTPASVMVLAIIGIVLGILTLLSMVWGAIALFVSFGPPNPMLDTIRHDPIHITFSVCSLVLGLLITLLLLASCIGSLNLWPWARRGMIVYAWLSIAQAIVGTIYNMAYAFPKMAAAIPAGADPATRTATIAGIFFFGGCGALFGLIYPILVLIFFGQSNVVNAFKGIFPASSADPLSPPPGETPQSPQSPFP